MCFTRHELDTGSVHSDAVEARPHGLHPRRVRPSERAEGPAGTLTGPSHHHRRADRHPGSGPRAGARPPRGARRASPGGATGRGAGSHAVIEQQDRAARSRPSSPLSASGSGGSATASSSPPTSTCRGRRGPSRATCLPRSDRVRVARGATGHREPAPAPQCACGIYAYFEPYRREWSPAYGWLVAGAVILLGKDRGAPRGHARGVRARRGPRAALPRLPHPAPADQAGGGAARGRGGVARRPAGRGLRHGRPIPSALLPR